MRYINLRLTYLLTSCKTMSELFYRTNKTLTDSGKRKHCSVTLFTFVAMLCSSVAAACLSASGHSATGHIGRVAVGLRRSEVQLSGFPAC